MTAVLLLLKDLVLILVWGFCLSNRETENYYAAGLWYFGIGAYLFKVVGSVPFTLVPVLMTSFILTPPKSPL